ncbi:MAG: glycosyltransferase [Alphaproteobacteria bacterium]|nr:MAG: glycosyltransferase [Alphaproteobacteria bacterium]TAF39392.1 MAG: glycosyltransferase [Alphaproteobacteria bacterium]TAF74949.1 MAG: glycosyltransferase [Alphaproteobacteria bacterium]
MPLPNAHVLCIKWGTKYRAHDVNRLYHMVMRNVQQWSVQFHCFTDDYAGLDAAIITHPLPEIHVADQNDIKYVYRKEVGLCDDDLGGLRGQRVMFLDLDVVVTDSLDPFFAYPHGDEFIIIKDWNTRGNHVGQASCYSWVVGTLGFIKADFESRPKEVVAQYFTASQEYLSAHVIARYGALRFWEESWCRSFKQHALPVWYRRAFTTPKLPEGTRILAFHGDPKMEDALVGRWSSKPVPFFKRFYKTIRPSPWLADYDI